MIRIPVEQLKAGYLYKIRGRNSNCGIYKNEVDYGYYRIARNKFGHDYLDIEIDRDVGGHCGTATPIEEIEKVPDFFTENDILKYLMEWRNKFGQY